MIVKTNMNLSDCLNVTPHKRVKADVFLTWEEEYKPELEDIYNIFVNRLKGIDPFSQKDLDKAKFNKEIYKVSSGYINYG